jgi:acyl-CoA thioester hydrolase
MNAPLHRHVTEVAFGDTDASGLMHFPSVFRYVEAAEHAFLKARGIHIFSREYGGWPRVHVDCDYRQMLFFGDVIEVRLGLSRMGDSSLTWVFEIWKGEQRCASGSMVTVRVDGTGKPVEIDEATRQALDF